jgi:fructose-1,6-bisphosphatase/inositol monophosphatase family enzyme
MQSGRPVLGVVLDPVADEAFSAARGQGAFLNGVRLPF